MTTAIRSDYDIKPHSYFEETRPEMQAFVPQSARRILDVGCGSGGFGASLKKSRNAEVWGVEPFETAAHEASKRLDKAIYGFFDRSLELPEGTFDCVIFNDVLEHLIDPDAAIVYARSLLAQNGVLVASIPNIRHFPTIWHLVIHGEWKYRDCGTLDKTHLRFFTRDSIQEMFGANAFSVEQICGIHPYRGIPNASKRVWKLFNLMNSISLKRFNDMKYERFAVVAKPLGAGECR